tara:strand:+ start:149 stop:457 length:309 start_codon:yes stop_codon:yes gene_type:complete
LVEFAKRYPGFSLVVGIFIGWFLYLAISDLGVIVSVLLIIGPLFTPKDWAYILVPFGSFFLLYFGFHKRNPWLVLLAILGFVSIIAYDWHTACDGLEAQVCS